MTIKTIPMIKMGYDMMEESRTANRIIYCSNKKIKPTTQIIT